MSYINQEQLIEGLVVVANEEIENPLRLYEYKTIALGIYSEEVINTILEKFKFKDIGSIEDFDGVVPQSSTVDVNELYVSKKKCNRICVSRKYNTALYYNTKSFSIEAILIIGEENKDRVVKKLKKIITSDNSSSVFRKDELTCGGKEYVEICGSNDDKKIADIVKKEITDEKLVFNEKSTLFEVLNDITTFFTDETKELYDKLDIAYKRGIILYGDPGNGKSAMIRELIRKIPNVSKIVINPSIDNPIRILNGLVKSLNGQKAIIIIEDFDSIITDYNRSELLNILDGIDVKSGIVFIGTTNYYERIDPAFMNRAGRFDISYKIDNPDENSRRLFFESRDITGLLSDYDVYSSKDKKKDKTVIELFVDNSKDLPMANLKELITSTCYVLANNEGMSIKEAVEKTYNKIKTNREEHATQHTMFAARPKRERRNALTDY